MAAPPAEGGGPSSSEAEPSRRGASAGAGPGPGIARLYLNLGRKDGAQDVEIRELLRAHAGVTAVEEIDVMNTHTYLNVAAGDADSICGALNGKQIGDRELVCERARPRR